jgi:hypothetical protein
MVPIFVAGADFHSENDTEKGRKVLFGRVGKRVVFWGVKNRYAVKIGVWCVIFTVKIRESGGG